MIHLHNRKTLSAFYFVDSIGALRNTFTVITYRIIIIILMLNIPPTFARWASASFLSIAEIMQIFTINFIHVATIYLYVDKVPIFIIIIKMIPSPDESIHTPFMRVLRNIYNYINYCNEQIYFHIFIHLRCLTALNKFQNILRNSRHVMFDRVLLTTPLQRQLPQNFLPADIQTFVTPFNWPQIRRSGTEHDRTTQADQIHPPVR